MCEDGDKVALSMVTVRSWVVLVREYGNNKENFPFVQASDFHCFDDIKDMN